MRREGIATIWLESEAGEREISVYYRVSIDSGSLYGFAIEALFETDFSAWPWDQKIRRLSDFSEKEVAKISDGAEARAREELVR